MTKAQQLQRAVDWIIDNGMQERFCTISLVAGKPRVSFLSLVDMVNTLRWSHVKVSSTNIPRAMNFSTDVDGIEFYCSSESGCVGPGTYVLDDSILNPELVA